MSKPTLSIKDLSANFNEAIKQLRNKQTLVGIPQEENPRDDGPIGNAALLYINNYGSPINNIPPRPVMDIGIAKVQKQIIEEFKRCAQAAMTKGNAVYDKYFERIGMIASNSVKQVINDQEGIVGPAESTLKAREAKGFKGTKSLVVTGQMRGAITYVVK